MSLTLYYHPLSSFCMKVLVALYENDTPFTPHFVDLRNPADREPFLKIWPVGKFPVLRDDTCNRIIPETSVIIAHLDRHYPGKTRFIPEDAGTAPLHVHTPPLRRLEWEHIQRVLAECDGNISEAARRLGLHRRTLQRKLSKRPVREVRGDNR